MKRRWNLLVPLCALLFQPLPILFIRVAAASGFGAHRWLPETWIWNASMAGLAACAAVSLALGGVGVYVLLRRSRLAVAIPLIALCCVPALIGGAVYLRAVLVFFTVV